MQCQAITLIGTQCSRKSSANSNYCWQHKNYVPGTYVATRNEQKSPVRIQTPVKIQSPKRSNAPYVNIDEFKRISSSTGPKIGNEEGADDYKKSLLKNTIIAKGPFTLMLEVGQYAPTVLEFEQKFLEGTYTFEQLIDDIRVFYDREATHADFFKLIRLSDEHKDDLSREIFQELQDAHNAGEDIRLVDFMGSHIYIEGFQYDAMRNLYFLILGS
jgi:hypothetical protein